MGVTHIGEKVSTKSVTDNIPRVQPPIFTPTMPKLADLDNLPWDAAEWIRILEYHPNQRDGIRRKYWLRGPCQPRGHTYPIRMTGNQKIHFSDDWFDKHGDWLEYSMKVDKIFCLCCYLCSDYMGNKGGSDSFMIKGFNCWNKTKRLITHVGEFNSYHNRALQCCEDLMKQGQYIDVAFHKQADIVIEANQIRLKATTEECRFCLKCVLPFRGHDERETSLFKGNFLETMDLILSQNLPQTAGNNLMKSPSIQKDIANCFKEEVLESILNEVGDDVFSLLVDESSDVSKKEQMAYVDAHGVVKERLVGLVHMKETTSLCLKASIDNFFAKHNLSLG